MVKHLVVSNSLIYKLVGSVWTNTELVGTPTEEEFETHGMDDIVSIGEDVWGELEKPVEILTWTNDEEATELSVDYSIKEFITPQLELTVPEYNLLDDLERPISVITCTDGEDVPQLKSEYNQVGIGTRIMKRG